MHIKTIVVVYLSFKKYAQHILIDGHILKCEIQSSISIIEGNSILTSFVEQLEVKQKQK